MVRNNIFLAIYTNAVKSYCDEAFFKNLSLIVTPYTLVNIVDNSKDANYALRLQSLCDKYNIKAQIHHIEVDDGDYFFQRSVLLSVNYLRDLFLETECEHFVIIESDVIPPKNVIRRLTDSIKCNPDFGAIGGVYYKGIHRFTSEALVEEDCVFSGCTIYQRELIEDRPFRWDINVEGCFPDSCMKYDAIEDGWRVGNIRNLQCLHIK